MSNQPNINDFPVLSLDPSTCKPSGINREVFADDEYNVMTGEELPGEGLRESIKRSGGNLENGIVVALAESDEDGCAYKILSGHRRWSICREEGLPFRALVLPADTSPGLQVEMAVWANSSQRDQSPIDRIRAAKHVEPQIREALAANKQAGVLLTDTKTPYRGRFAEVVARMFFDDRRKKGWVEQLQTVYEASIGEGALLDAYPKERDRTKAQERARECVALIHIGHMTVGEAHRSLTAVKKTRTSSDGRTKTNDEVKAERKEALARSALVGAVSALVRSGGVLPPGLSPAEERVVKDGSPQAVKNLVSAYVAAGGKAEEMFVAVRAVNDVLVAASTGTTPKRRTRKKTPTTTAVAA